MTDETPKRVHALCWLDVETTGLHSETDHLLEIAYRLTAFDYPFETIAARFPIRSEASFLIDSEGSRRLLAGECSSFIQEMHTKSGLLADLRARPRVPLLAIELELLELSESWPLDKEEKVQLAGNSVAFDLGFLRHHMPAFASRLSYRTFDASSHYRFCLSVGMQPLPKPEETHRSAADVERSIMLARSCAEWVLERRTEARGEAQVKT